MLLKTDRKNEAFHSAINKHLTTQVIMISNRRYFEVLNNVHIFIGVHNRKPQDPVGSFETGSQRKCILLKPIILTRH